MASMTAMLRRQSQRAARTEHGALGGRVGSGLCPGELAAGGTGFPAAAVSAGPAGDSSHTLTGSSTNGGRNTRTSVGSRGAFQGPRNQWREASGGYTQPIRAPGKEEI